MSNEAVFRNYLNRRLQAAGAVTPEQQIEVIKTLLDEATRNGMVPIDDEHIARLDPNDPAVQAALRGENVVVSGRRVIRRGVSFRTSMVNLPTPMKIAVLALIALVPVFGVLLVISGFSKISSQPLVTSTPDINLVLGGNLAATPTTVVIDQRPIVAKSDKDLVDVPVSLEIGEIRIILGSRSLGDGVGFSAPVSDWVPSGAEWLSGSRIRRVVALPEGQIDAGVLRVGQNVTVRYKNGYLASFVITYVGDVSVDQIEVMRSNVPSLLIVLVSSDKTWRRIAIAEQSDLVAIATRAAMPTQEPPKTAVTVRSVRLRSGPSLNSDVITMLDANTMVTLVPGKDPVVADNIVWVCVSVDGQEGWVASTYIK